MENQFIKKASILILIGSLTLCLAAFILRPEVSSNSLQPKSSKKINLVDLQNKVRVGDWVVREGTGYESALIKKLSQSQYSHIGIISQVSPDIQIIHATTDDLEYQKDQVIKTNFEHFTDQSRAHSWAIIRLSLLSSDEHEQIVAKIKSDLGKPFVLDIKQQPHLYCTTLIAEKLPLLVQNQLQWGRIEIPGLKGEILFPVALMDLHDSHIIMTSTE